MSQLQYSNKFYLVDEELYKKCIQQPSTIDNLLANIKPKERKKCTLVLQFLEGNGVTWNMLGITTTDIPEIGMHFNIVDYVIYAVSPRGIKLVLFRNFMEYLKRLNAPLNFLSPKIRKLKQNVENEKEGK